jgi:hypothetical protein
MVHARCTGGRSRAPMHLTCVLALGHCRRTARPSAVVLSGFSVLVMVGGDCARAQGGVGDGGAGGAGTARHPQRGGGAAQQGRVGARAGERTAARTRRTPHGTTPVCISFLSALYCTLPTRRRRSGQRVLQHPAALQGHTAWEAIRRRTGSCTQPTRSLYGVCDAFTLCSWPRQTGAATRRR